MWKIQLTYSQCQLMEHQKFARSVLALAQISDTPRQHYTQLLQNINAIPETYYKYGNKYT